MRALFRVTCVVAAAATCGNPASAAPTQPTGKWVVDYDKDECLLERDFGTQDRPLAVMIERFPMDTDLKVLVFSTNGGGGINSGQAKVRFGTAEPVTARFSAYPMAQVHLRRFTANVENGAPIISEAVTGGTIAINASSELKQVFAVPGLGEALKALDACVLDLGKSWGISAEQQQRLETPAKAVRHDYLQPSDYPTKQLNEGANGRSLVRLTVDEAGKPLDCIPLKSVESPAFAQTTCRLLMNRASFHPAIGVDGKAMRSVVVYTVNWIVAG